MSTNVQNGQNGSGTTSPVEHSAYTEVKSGFVSVWEHDETGLAVELAVRTVVHPREMTRATTGADEHREWTFSARPGRGETAVINEEWPPLDKTEAFDRVQEWLDEHPEGGVNAVDGEGEPAGENARKHAGALDHHPKRCGEGGGGA